MDRGTTMKIATYCELDKSKFSPTDDFQFANQKQETSMQSNFAFVKDLVKQKTKGDSLDKCIAKLHEVGVIANLDQETRNELIQFKERFGLS